MPKLIEETPKEDDRLVEPKQIEPVRVVLDPSSPSIGSVVRVTIVAMVLLFIGSRIENVIGSLTYLFFLLVLSIFFAYLISPLVNMIRRPFKARSAEQY